MGEPFAPNNVELKLNNHLELVVRKKEALLLCL